MQRCRCLPLLKARCSRQTSSTTSPCSRAAAPLSRSPSRRLEWPDGARAGPGPAGPPKRALHLHSFHNGNKKSPHAEIDALNERIYPKLNNGVYRTGFATTQLAYEEAFADVFAMLDELEARLESQKPFLFGSRPTCGCSLRLFASTPLITACSSAIFAGLQTILASAGISIPTGSFPSARNFHSRCHKGPNPFRRLQQIFSSSCFMVSAPAATT